MRSTALVLLMGIAFLALESALPWAGGAAAAGFPSVSPASVPAAAATRPALLTAVCSGGYRLELVGARYEGDHDFEAGRNSYVLQLRCRLSPPASAGGAEAVPPAMKLAAWDLAQALDQDGSDLRARARPMIEGDALRPRLRDAMRVVWSPQAVISFGLVNLSAAPRTLTGVRGRVDLLAPSAVVSKDLALEPGDRHDLAEGMVGQIEKVEKAGTNQVTVSYAYYLTAAQGPTASPFAPALLDRLEVIDAAGGKLTVVSPWERSATWYRTDSGYKVTGTITAKGAGDQQMPAKLRVSVFTGIRHQAVAFEFPAIPLARLLAGEP